MWKHRVASILRCEGVGTKSWKVCYFNAHFLRRHTNRSLVRVEVVGEAAHVGGGRGAQALRVEEW